MVCWAKSLLSQGDIKHVLHEAYGLHIIVCLLLSCLIFSSWIRSWRRSSVYFSTTVRNGEGEMLPDCSVVIVFFTQWSLFNSLTYSWQIYNVDWFTVLIIVRHTPIWQTMCITHLIKQKLEFGKLAGCSTFSSLVSMCCCFLCTRLCTVWMVRLPLDDICTHLCKSMINYCTIL